MFHRFDVTGGVETGFVVPSTGALATGRYSRPAPKRHWWSDEPPRPQWEGFALYVTATPRPLTHEQTQGRGEAIPPWSFEVHVSRGAQAAVVVHYALRTPRWAPPPATPEGAAYAARIAELEAALAEDAEALARLALAGSGAQLVVPASETQRTRSYEETQAHCRRYLLAGR